MIAIRAYTVPEFAEYLRQWRQKGAVQKATFLHHTWRPAAADYAGPSTIEAIRRAHLARGFADIACNAYAAPDGTVYNARPPTTANCACQAPALPPTQWPAWPNILSGARVIGWWRGPSKWHAKGMPKELLERFNELSQHMPKHMAAQVLLEELIGRKEPITPRKWSVEGLGPNWGK